MDRMVDRQIWRKRKENKKPTYISFWNFCDFFLQEPQYVLMAIIGENFPHTNRTVWNVSVHPVLFNKVWLQGKLFYDSLNNKEFKRLMTWKKENILLQLPLYHTEGWQEGKTPLRSCPKGPGSLEDWNT
jgi:hypothetical protein